jgi:hypothetical protein
MAITATVDMSVLTDTMRRYITELKYDSKEVLRRGMLLTANNLNKFTPYFNKKQGMKAVLRDVTNAVSLMEAKNFNKNTEMYKMIQRKRYDQFNEMLDDRKDLFAGKVKEAVPFTDRLITDVQDKRGHVRKPTGVVTFDGKAWRAALKKRQKDLFTMKKSYLPAILASGGQGSGFWMKASRIDGSAIPNLDAPDPTFSMENHAKGISIVNRFKAYILAKVNKAMVADIRFKLKHNAQTKNLT